MFCNELATYHKFPCHHDVCKRNSRVTVFLNTFPERSHIFFHKRVCMRIRTDYFFVLPTFSQCTLKSNPKPTHIKINFKYINPERGCQTPSILDNPRVPHCAIV